MRALTLPRTFALVTLASSTLACAGAPEGPWAEASTDPATINITPASFAEGSGVSDAVLSQCNLERGIPEKIARHAKVPVVLTEQDSGARTLSLEITYVQVPADRDASGPKSVTVVGELYEGAEDELTGSFEVERTTTNNGGTCDMLNLVIDEIGKDVAAWLAKPSLEAELGG